MESKKDARNYVYIYSKIAHGLRTDYIEPETKHVWKVKNYLEGKTRGIEVYTLQGKFLGTAYTHPDMVKTTK